MNLGHTVYKNPQVGKEKKILLAEDETKDNPENAEMYLYKLWVKAHESQPLSPFFLGGVRTAITINES